MSQPAETSVDTSPGGREAATAKRLTPEELCREYAGRVHRFALMLAGDQAEADDLAQTALEKALRALPRFDPERGEAEAWLWRIVVNAARDAGRSARRRHSLMERLASLRDSPPSPPDDIPVGISDDRLLAAVRQLTPHQRSVVALRFGADLDHAAVGRALGISRAAASVATYRAITALRGMLQEPSS
ncbi:MAG: sigma-70 family RNA polymerase sigma factor [Candidatus Dormibacteraeota bacterium]|uniref:Sigma-70 family RNA polymerase sigma factor n=1 Tax=Candidatus Aeolococcus gillhamiae TaxID=3127015 RepID=A0A934JS84_9BACT|nr:sigma-70 family RNA polymerase sigma factor [Candidatus Dormibacteraeota bacterium]